MEVIDLGFMYCQVIRFYGLSDEAVMRLPIRRFWLLLKNIRRLMAQEELRLFNLMLHQDAKTESVKDFMGVLRREVGETHRAKPVFDRAGLEELKRLG